MGIFEDLGIFIPRILKFWKFGNFYTGNRGFLNIWEFLYREFWKFGNFYTGNCGFFKIWEFLYREFGICFLNMGIFIPWIGDVRKFGKFCKILDKIKIRCQTVFQKKSMKNVSKPNRKWSKKYPVSQVVKFFAQDAKSYLIVEISIFKRFFGSWWI